MGKAEESGARIVDPTPEEIKIALRLCATDEPDAEGYPCKRCYLYPFKDEDGYMSTGQTCFMHLTLDAIGLIDRMRAERNTASESGTFHSEQSKKQAEEIKMLRAELERTRKDRDDAVDRARENYIKFVRQKEENENSIKLPEPKKSDYMGLKVKYRVFKAKDNSPVEGCFVLRPDVDSVARDALREYARKTNNRNLSMDILNWIRCIEECADQSGEKK